MRIYRGAIRSTIALAVSSAGIDLVRVETPVGQLKSEIATFSDIVQESSLTTNTSTRHTPIINTKSAAVQDTHHPK